jgi:hypothetical protein
VYPPIQLSSKSILTSGRFQPFAGREEELEDETLLEEELDFEEEEETRELLEDELAELEEEIITELLEEEVGFEDEETGIIELELLSGADELLSFEEEEEEIADETIELTTLETEEETPVSLKLYKSVCNTPFDFNTSEGEIDKLPATGLNAILK